MSDKDKKTGFGALLKRAFLVDPEEVPAEDTGGNYLTESTGEAGSVAAEGGAAPVAAPILADNTTSAELEKRFAAAIAAIQTSAVAAFIAQMDALEEFIPEEKTRAKAALKALSGSGHQTETIINDIAKVIAAVDGEAQKMCGFVDNRLSQIQQQKTKDATRVGGALQEKREALKALQMEISALEAEQKTIDQKAVRESTMVQQLMSTIGKVAGEARKHMEAYQQLITLKGANAK